MESEKFEEAPDEKGHSILASLQNEALKICEYVGPKVKKFNKLAIEKIGPYEENRTGSTKWTEQIFTPKTEAEVLGAVLTPVILSAVGIPIFHLGSFLFCTAARDVYDRVKRPTEHNTFTNLAKGAVAATLLTAAVGFGPAAMGTAGWLVSTRMNRRRNRDAAAAQFQPH
ncbi:MAG: hypothetical protein PHW76_06970 [Alphaproteobacteria bacterium]|nr:hypothetical protein [Alphaproteobacteria bacterium]